MINTRIIKPYDTEMLVYNYKTHRYEPTVFGCKALLGIDLLDFVRTEQSANALLQEISEDVYALVRRYTLMGYFYIKEHYMSCGESLREYVEEALYAQLRYALRSGGNLIKSQHGINLDRGFTVPTNKIRGFVEHESRVYDMLADCGLLHLGKFDKPLSMIYEKGVDY